MLAIKDVDIAHHLMDFVHRELDYRSAAIRHRDHFLRGADTIIERDVVGIDD